MWNATYAKMQLHIYVILYGGIYKCRLHTAFGLRLCLFHIIYIYLLLFLDFFLSCLVLYLRPGLFHPRHGAQAHGCQITPAISGSNQALPDDNLVFSLSENIVNLSLNNRHQIY